MGDNNEPCMSFFFDDKKRVLKEKLIKKKECT
jgi:hypothetical protein